MALGYVNVGGTQKCAKVFICDEQIPALLLCKVGCNISICYSVMGYTEASALKCACE